MVPLTVECKKPKRRRKLRESDKALNGLDYIEVSEDQRRLRVYFLRKASPKLREAFAGKQGRKHVVITGGRRIPTIAVEKVTLHHTPDPGRDDYLEITVASPGDFSRYTLRLAALDEAGRPVSAPMAGIDPRYDRLQFSFKEHCPTDLDCKTPHVCPPPRRPQPDINYLAKDYAGFRQLILDRMADVMQERHVPDIGIALAEVLAYTGDHLSYYQDAVATEAYLETARQRISVRRHTRLIDYPMHEGTNARTWLFIHIDQDFEIDPEQIYFITRLPETTTSETMLPEEKLDTVPQSAYEIFEPLPETEGTNIRLYSAHNEIAFYTWGESECCLPRGATTATLKDAWAGESERELHLAPGDILLFEEVKGPGTGNPVDADRTRRHFVRLTRVEPAIDPLDNQPVVEIEWAEEDALPFPLCLSAMGPPPECRLIDNISVARGNIILVHHGRRIDDENLGCVGLDRVDVDCACEGLPTEAVLLPAPFRPHLKHGPLTFCQPLDPGAPASTMLRQDPKKALPHLEICSRRAVPGGSVEKTCWQPVRDLLGSDHNDEHVVVEIDNHGCAHLRFGDNQCGRQPEAGELFTAGYRVGIGPAGNVGAEAISHLILRRGFTLSGVKVQVRNPVPATGGVEAESLEEVKHFAPVAFRTHLERAITAEDYARIAERHPQVQHAAATLRWTGSWYEVLVAIDPFGRVEAEAALLESIAAYLARFRRMGHDVRVARARFVPLDIVLNVCVLPGYLRSPVKAELLQLFSNKTLADGRRGFFHPDNLTFGQPIRLSALVAAAQQVAGVENAIVTRLERAFEGPNHEIENGMLAIGPLEIARVDNDPDFPENGRIEIIVQGGR